MSKANATGLQGYCKAALVKALAEVADGRPVESAMARLPDYQREAQMDAARRGVERATARLQRTLDAEREAINKQRQALDAQANQGSTP